MKNNFIKTIMIVINLSLLFSSPLLAANYFIRVGGLNDGLNSSTVCVLEAGTTPNTLNFEGTENCNLRTAINLANQQGSLPYSADQIFILLNGGQHSLTLLRNNNDNTPDNDEGDLDINLSNPDSHLFIIGRGIENSLVVQAGSQSRIFDIHRGQVSFQDFTIANGYAGSIPSTSLLIYPDDPNYYFISQGGGIRNRPPANLTLQHMVIRNNIATNSGGGIYNEGTLTLNETALRQNSVFTSNERQNGWLCQYTPGKREGILNSNWNVYASGGGLANNGNSATALISNSEISDNRACRSGGGIVNDNSAIMNIVNSTLMYNKTLGIAILDSNNDITKIGSGGAIANFRNGILSLNFSTLYRNESLREGGGIINGFSDYSPSGSSSSIVSNNSNAYSPGTLDLKGNLILANITDSDFLLSQNTNLYSAHPHTEDCAFHGTTSSQLYNTFSSNECMGLNAVRIEASHDRFLNNMSGITPISTDSRSALNFFSNYTAEDNDSIPANDCNYNSYIRTLGSSQIRTQNLTRDQINQIRPYNGACDRGAIENTPIVGTRVMPSPGPTGISNGTMTISNPVMMTPTNSKQEEKTSSANQETIKENSADSPKNQSELDLKSDNKNPFSEIFDLDKKGTPFIKK